MRIAQTFSPLIAGLVVAGLGFQMLYYLAAGLSFLMVICCLLASPLLSEKAIVEKNTVIKISGIDKQLVGKVSSEIKMLKPVEPYKGKGIKERGQYVLRKEGKKK